MAQLFMEYTQNMIFLFLAFLTGIVAYLIWHYVVTQTIYFYTPTQICPSLISICDIADKVLAETINLNNKTNTVWEDWPEKYLYASNGNWKIFPFYAFGIWVNDNCQKCPTITKFLHSIKGLRLATLSKLTAGMKLTPHKGWASHSNYVIRCHYGIIVPDDCSIIVVDDNGKSYRKFHKYQEWLIFDDSMTHYAENNSKDDRIVLIIDVDRPENIPIGKSDIGDSKELLDIVQYFKEKNIN